MSEERLVTVTWTEEQLEENSACTDLFEVKKEEQELEQSTARSRDRSKEEGDAGAENK